MINIKEVIKDIITENQARDFSKSYLRRIDIPTDTSLIISLIGVRRSGKTHLLYNIINTLLKKGITKEYVLFINFEDERLQLQTHELNNIIEAYEELYPEIDFEKVHLFFDEIQNVDGWEKFVRRIYDSKTKNIYITGSNSKLLSTEIATSLRGRTLSYTVYPLNFEEYLDFQGIKKKLTPQKERSKVLHHAEQFLFNGGFAETIQHQTIVRRKLLQEYFNVMLFRDIVERYQIANVNILKFFIKKIFTSVTLPFSINKTYNDLKSIGYKISNNYLYDYFNYCNDIFMCQSINRFDYSEIKQSKSDKKTYIIDTGLLSAIEFSVSQNKGKLFENLVFLELLKRGNTIFYYKNQYECDFIIEQDHRFSAIQVAYDLEDEITKKREFRGLIEACDYLKTTQGTIITFEHEEEITYKDYHIKIIPFYKFF